jgi:hypothetical protein
MNYVITMLAALVSAPTATPEQVDLCVAMGDMSAVIMTGRQNGVSYAKLYGIATSNENPEVRALAQAMVDRAYEVPRYRNKQDQADAVLQFREMVEVMCVEQTNKREQFDA